MEAKALNSSQAFLPSFEDGREVRRRQACGGRSFIRSPWLVTFHTWWPSEIRLDMIIEVCSDLLDYCSGISSSLMKSFILKMPFSYAIESRYSVVVGKVPQTL